MNQYYKILIEFTHGTTPCYKHLVNRYGENIVNEIIERKYIVPSGKTDIGDLQYQITPLGRKIRDN